MAVEEDDREARFRVKVRKGFMREFVLNAVRGAAGKISPEDSYLIATAARAAWDAVEQKAEQ